MRTPSGAFSLVARMQSGIGRRQRPIPGLHPGYEVVAMSRRAAPKANTAVRSTEDTQ